MDQGERRSRREAQRVRTARQRRAVALAGVAALALLVGVAVGAGGGSDGGTQNAEESADRPPELPGGGRRLFPDRRVVAFYGAPQDEELGELGIGTPASAAKRLVKQARPYATRRRPVLPTFELLAVVAAAAPGEGDLYRTRQEDAVIRRYLRAARKAKAMLLLDIQPGRADFLTEAKALKRWLREPDVGLALDPEWRMDAGEVPGDVIVSVDAAEVNSVSNWLAGVVREGNLPEKLLLVHRFTEDMVERPDALESPAGVQLTLNVDGFGTKAQKLAKYRVLVPRRFRAGFKLFYREDTGLMSPREVNALKPLPDVVVYE
jgi:hypothetical protein